MCYLSLHCTVFLALSSFVYSPVSVSSVTVPKYGVHGEHAVLYCIYSSIQPVYSVRWYKNGKEFFRYVQQIRKTPY